MRFGLGLSPFALYRTFDKRDKEALTRKLGVLGQFGIDDLAILFDDMPADVPRLAATQVDIVHYVAERTTATRLIVCPSYYTDDRALDRFVGQRPENYLEDMGLALDTKIEIFWTGPKVCSPEITIKHLSSVSEKMRRKPFLWDNYPVNDGPRMSQHLHLRPFQGRSAVMRNYIAGHGINAASQPTLSLIPALTLAETYVRGSAYDSKRAFLPAATEILGSEFARRVDHDLQLLQDVRLDKLGRFAAKLRSRYCDLDHPGAREIIAWLDGRWRITHDEIAEQ